MQVALRERCGYARFGPGTFNHEAQVAADNTCVDVTDISNQYSSAKISASVPKSSKMTRTFAGRRL
jgi:hypothetical protein